MKFYLDTTDSAQTKQAKITLGDEPGGDLIATIPYETHVHKVRAQMLAATAELWEEFEGVRNLWWYQGKMKHECPHCHCQSFIGGASDAQIGRMERIRAKMLAQIPE